MTSAVGTSASTVVVMQRFPFCLAVTTAVAVERPSLTTSMSSSTGPAPTMTARANTAVHRAHRLVGKPLGGGHDRLREYLRALDHLSLVVTGKAGLRDERVRPARLQRRRDRAAPAPSTAPEPNQSSFKIASTGVTVEGNSNRGSPIAVTSLPSGSRTAKGWARHGRTWRKGTAGFRRPPPKPNPAPPASWDRRWRSSARPAAPISPCSRSSSGPRPRCGRSTSTSPPRTSCCWRWSRRSWPMSTAHWRTETADAVQRRGAAHG